MKKQKSTLFSLLCVLLTAIGIIFSGCNKSPVTGNSQSADAVYDRVIKSGTIRCAYVVYPPGCIKDPNTGKLSGIFVDTINEAAKNLGLKAEWTEEVSWGTMIEGLQTDRYDLVASPVWANSTRAKHADFSVPLMFSGIGVYVRQKESRFGSGLTALNSPSVKIATVDGEMTDIISQSEFPNAQRVSHPQNTDVSLVLQDVAQGKADVTFVEPYYASQFLKNNPETLKNLVAAKPIRIFPNTMMFKQGDFEFKPMLDTALQELVNSGYVDKKINQYDSSG